MSMRKRFSLPLHSVAHLGIAALSLCLPAMAQLAEPIRRGMPCRARRAA